MPAPYTNPYYFQNNPAYQQYNNPQNPYEHLAQLRNQLNMQPPYQSYQPSQPVASIGLSGEIVDSIDVVNAKNVDLSGNITYYPKSDMSEIYTKQLQPDGRSRTLVYRLVTEEGKEEPQQNVTMDTLNNLLNQVKQDIVSEIKAIIPDNQQNKNNRQGKGVVSE